MTKLISAYIDLDKWTGAPIDEYDLVVEGDLIRRSPEGMEIDFGYHGSDIPPEAQIYLEWVPVVYAVWNEENNGEDGNDEDGLEDGTGGEANSQESDSEPGQPGPSDAGEQPAEA